MVLGLLVKTCHHKTVHLTLNLSFAPVDHLAMFKMGGGVDVIGPTLQLNTLGLSLETLDTALTMSFSVQT